MTIYSARKSFFAAGLFGLPGKLCRFRHEVLQRRRAVCMKNSKFVAIDLSDVWNMNIDVCVHILIILPDSKIFLLSSRVEGWHTMTNDKNSA